LAATRRSLEGASAEAARWQNLHGELLKGLSHGIDQQLETWRLTPAEKDVAFLLLKGLSFKEIAPVRGDSERTVRQQALAVYAKSGLAGRAELSAFFLEDLLAPTDSRSA
jgi:DNA-binding CsgD family transcriptional regulator